MLASRAEIPTECTPPRGRKHRLFTVSALDGRTVAARRAKELAAGFAAELGSTITATQRFAIERAAALVALSEDAKARRLSGDPTISLEDLIRVDNAAGRAVKALGIKPGAGPHKEPGAALDEYLARNHGTPEPAPT
jgi:hypothetical protein